MGQPIARLEARAKVTAAARFASDMPLARPAYAYLVTSTIAKGRISAIDETAARAVPGVLHILTHRNRPAVQPIKHFFEGGSALTSVPPLAGPDVAYEGQIVAMVTAESFEAAREAAHRLVLRYERQKPTASFGDAGAVEQRTSEVIPMRKDVMLGNAQAGFTAAAVVHDAEYATPVQHHNSMELLATSAMWLGDEPTVYEPTQFVYGLRNALALQLAIPPEKIRIVDDFVGGAFGGKGAVTHRTALVVLVAKMPGRPVKLVATRDQGFTISGHRHETKPRAPGGHARWPLHRLPPRPVGVERPYRSVRQRRHRELNGDVRFSGGDEQRAHAARRPQPADLHALAARSAGDVRARVGDRRAGDQAGDGPGRAAPHERHRQELGHRQALPAAA